MSGELLPGLVTVVIAAHNRPNVRHLAIETVRWQDRPQREIWVSGDACKERGPGEAPEPDGFVRDAVESFNDPRNRFHNFDENFGEQSRQNNEFTIGPRRPETAAIPPGAWHGAINVDPGPCGLINVVSRAYD